MSPQTGDGAELSGVCSIANVEDQFATDMLGFAEFVSANGCRQWHGCYLWQPKDACLHIRSHTIHQSTAPVDGWPQGSDVFARSVRGVCATCNEGCSSAGFQHREGLCDRCATHGIESGIAIAKKGGRIFPSVVDDLVCAQTTYIGMIFGSRRSHDLRAKMMRQLDRHSGDTPGSALDQNLLAAFQLQRILNGDESRERGKTDRRRLDM